MAAQHEYAVSWREAEGVAPLVGRLRLAQRQLRMEGHAPLVHEASRVVSYADIDGVETRRVRGHRVLELVLSSGRRIVIASLDRTGSLGELAFELRTRATT